MANCDAKWTLGMVEELHRGRDGIIREVVIKYCNSSEQKLSLTKGKGLDSTYPRYTERAVRRLIKIFSIEDDCLADDLAELAKKYEHFKRAEDILVDVDDATAQVVYSKPENCESKKKQQAECCCQEHCNLTSHYHGNRKMVMFEKNAVEVNDMEESEIQTDIEEELSFDVDKIFNL